MKRKILYGFALLPFFIGCEVREENEATKQEEQMQIHAILHTTTATNPQAAPSSVAHTRAATTVADVSFDTHGFRVVGYHTTDLFGTALDNSGQPDLPFPNVFDYQASGQPAVLDVKKGSDGKYTTPFSKRPLSDLTYLSFFAWTQGRTSYNSTSGIVDQVKDQSTKGNPWIDIVVDEVQANQVDIAGARNANRSNNFVITSLDLEFQHLLAKLSFKAKSISGAKAQFSSIKAKYTANRVYKKARFSFNTDAELGNYAAYSTFSTAETSLGSNITMEANSNTPADLGQMMLLPQTLANKDIQIEFKYRILLNTGILGPEITRTVPLSALTYGIGNHYIYTFNISADEIILATHPQVGSWNEGSVGATLPLIAGPRGDALLILDGSDDPYYDNTGSVCWLDKSGYNNHATTISGKPTYSIADKGYYFNGGTGNAGNAGNKDVLRLSKSLGNSPNFTLELIVKVPPVSTTNNELNSLIFFTYKESNTDPDRQCHVHLPRVQSNVPEIYFNSPNSGGKTFVGWQADYYNNVVKFTFIREEASGSLISSIWKGNSKLVSTTLTSVAMQNMTHCYIGAQNNTQYFTGHVMAVRFYGKALSDNEIRSSYESDRKIWTSLQP